MMQRQTSLQDTFLTRARRAKSPVTVFLMNGYRSGGSSPVSIPLP